MIIDKQTLFSEAQAVTADAASTNIYDTGSDADSGAGQPLRLFLTVTEAFDNLTSLAVKVQCDADSAFGSAKELYAVTVLLASLTLGARINLPPIPAGCERYIRLYYDVTGTAPTVGKVTAGILIDDQQNVATDGGTAY